MRRFAFFLIAVTLVSCSSGSNPPADNAGNQPAVGDDQAAAVREDGGSHDAMGEESGEQALLHREDPLGVYGAGVNLDEVSSISAILEDPASYEGQTVHVSGEVAEVCPMRGCWIEITDPTGGKMRVKVKDGDIVFPLSAKGRAIEVEGTVEKIEMDEEQARTWKQHEAEELGVEFDPASITGPMVMWRIWGAGAQIKG